MYASSLSIYGSYHYEVVESQRVLTLSRVEEASNLSEDGGIPGQRQPASGAAKG